MRRVLRIALSLTLSILMLAVVGLLIARSLVARELKRALEIELARKIDRTIEVGSVSVGLDHIDVRNVVVRDPPELGDSKDPRGSIGLEVGQLQLGYPLRTLLDGRVEITRIALTGLNLAVVGVGDHDTLTPVLGNLVKGLGRGPSTGRVRVSPELDLSLVGRASYQDDDGVKGTIDKVTLETTGPTEFRLSLEGIKVTGSTVISADTTKIALTLRPGQFIPIGGVTIVGPAPEIARARLLTLLARRFRPVASEGAKRLLRRVLRKRPGPAEADAPQ